MNYVGEFAFVLLFSFAIGLGVLLVIGRFLVRPENFIQRTLNNPQWGLFVDMIFYALTAIAVIGLVVHAILLYLNFRSGTNDLAMFDQIIWNSMHGRLFESSILAQAIQIVQGSPSLSAPATANQLGNHFAPILLAIVPLYAVISDPAMLRLVQTLAMVGMVFPLYWFARPRIGHGLALVVVVVFLISPLLPNINIYDFHETPLAMTPLGLAIFFLYRKYDIPFITCLLLALMVKEDIALIVAGLGLLIMLIQRRLVFGATVFAFGMLWAIVVVQWVMPQFSTQGMWLGSLYPAFGRNFLEIAQTLVSRPLFVLQYISTPEKLSFILQLVVPLALLPFGGFELSLIAAIPLMESLLGGSEIMYRPFTWYQATMIPFLFFGAVIGVERILKFKMDLRDKSKLLERKFALSALLLTSSLTTFYIFSPLPFARSFDAKMVLPDSRNTFGRELLRQIPVDAIVTVTDDVMPHVSERQWVYVFPSFPDYRQVDYLFVDKTGFWYRFHQGTWDDVLGSNYFMPLVQSKGFVLAKRQALEHALDVRFDDHIVLSGYTIPSADSLRGGQTLRPILGWRTLQPMTQLCAMRVQLIDQQGHVWAEYNGQPQDGHLPTTMWRVNATVNDQYALSLPSTMPPGNYRLTVSVYDLVSGQALGETANVASIRIEKDKSNITATDLQKQFQLDQPFFVDMGELRLLGFKFLPKSIASGDKFPIGLFWRAREKPRGDYTVSVQLIDVGGSVVAEQSGRPASGAYPTTQWDAGEVLLDWHDVNVPSSLKPGDYSVRVSLKDTTSSLVLGTATLGKTGVQP